MGLESDRFPRKRLLVIKGNTKEKNRKMQKIRIKTSKNLNYYDRKLAVALLNYNHFREIVGLFYTSFFLSISLSKTRIEEIIKIEE